MAVPTAIVARVLTQLRTACPDTVFVIEQREDGPNTLDVGAFNVDATHLASVTQAITDVDWMLFQEFGLGAVPIVRDKATTREHYPQYLNLWGETAEVDAVPLLPAMAQDARALDDTEICGEAANQEFALAA